MKSFRHHRLLLAGLVCLALRAAFLPGALEAWDFGLILDQTAGFGGLGGDGSFDYSLNLLPRVSGFVGDVGEFYASAGVAMDYRDELDFNLELLRTDFSFGVGSVELKLGRMYHSDPFGFIANGLFDGASASLDTAYGSFSTGAWYTGFLYKKRANIMMTAEEAAAHVVPVDFFGDLKNTYFAPRRLLASAGWEHFSLGGLAHARLELLAQFDVSGGDALHSQYLAAKVGIPVSVLYVDLGGAFELIEDGEKDMETAFVMEAGVFFVPPTSLRNRAAVLVRYASGGSDGSVSAFQPVTMHGQGSILGAKLSGLTMIALDYIARPLSTFSFNLKSSYFIRNDLGTYTAYPVSGSDSAGKMLGNEFFAQLMWSPFSDLQVNLGGGVFLPSMGDAAPKADSAWRVELNVVLSLY